MLLLFRPSTDLKYFSIIERLLGLGMLLVMIDIPPVQGRINLVCIIDLMFFNSVLIWKIWVLASPIIFLARSRGTGMIACFLEGPLVMGWIFLVLEGE